MRTWGMIDTEPKAVLQRYLQVQRDALVWKLEGLSEYDVRRPLVPTATNLLGLVKHLAAVELGYFGDTFARPHTESVPWWDDDAETNADMWATPEERRDDLIALYRRAWAHADATIDALDLDATGRVAWWGDDPVTLHLVLVHVIAETARHVGQADIVRELIDGEVGLRDGNGNMAPGDAEWWATYHERVEAAARDAGGV